MEPIRAGGKIVQATSNSVTFLIGMYGKFLSAVVQTSPGGQGFNGAEQKTIRAIEVVKPGGGGGWAQKTSLDVKMAVHERKL